MNLANEYYLKAANKKDAVAAFNLAESYELGKAVEINLDTALYWYKLSASLGDVDAKEKVKELEKKDCK